MINATTNRSILDDPDVQRVAEEFYARGFRCGKASAIRKACDVLRQEGWLGALSLHWSRDKEYLLDKFTKAMED